MNIYKFFGTLIIFSSISTLSFGANPESNVPLLLARNVFIQSLRGTFALMGLSSVDIGRIQTDIARTYYSEFSPDDLQFILEYTNKPWMIQVRNLAQSLNDELSQLIRTNGSSNLLSEIDRQISLRRLGINFDEFQEWYSLAYDLSIPRNQLMSENDLERVALFIYCFFKEHLSEESFSQWITDVRSISVASRVVMRRFVEINSHFDISPYLS